LFATIQSFDTIWHDLLTIIIIIIIIIIVLNTTILEPLPSLENSASMHPVFTCLDFVTILLQSKVVSLASNPNVEDHIFVFMSSSDRVAQLHPQAPGSLFVAFYDSQGYGRGILTRLQTEIINNSIIKEATKKVKSY
jgi:hypothetical protein